MFDNLLSANPRHNQHWIADEPSLQAGAVEYTYTAFEQYEDDCYLSAAAAAPHADDRHWSSLKIRCRQLLMKLAHRIGRLPH